ncbi:transposase IS4 family protein [Heyndrickxia coagulans]|uniref:Transposase IS4 family protein n=1 Tax=Heyndrickxia coagulans TaxID=1398 RepID=A0AAN0T9T0_HEYCO|nr:transposase IS4 family protein [Heyndrickxia coagulans]
MSSDCKKCLFVNSKASHIPVNAVIKFEFTIPILIKDKKSFNAEASAAFTLVVVSIVRLSATIVPPSNFSKPFKKNGLTRCRRIPFVNVFTLPIRKTVYYNYNPSFPFWLFINEEESVLYIIRLKSNSQLQSLAKEYHPSSAPLDVSKTETYYEETIYQAKSWSKPRRVIIQSVRPAGELFFTHSFFVTNFELAFPQDIVRAYQKRGTMENYIKEAKNGFYFDHMNSHAFLVNEVKMMLTLLAYNLTNWLRTLCFPEGQKTMQIDTIRTRLIKAASKVVKSGRSLYFKLSSSFVYQNFFWDVLNRIQKLQLE